MARSDTLRGWWRFATVVVVLFGAVALVAGLGLRLLYGTALEQAGERLRDIAQAEAALIEAIATIEAQKHPGASAGDLVEGPLRRLIGAGEGLREFGETGELDLARLEGDDVVYVVRHRHGSYPDYHRLSLHSPRADPMRQALRGGQGVIIALDYRGQEVLAAYRRLDRLELGLVAKIDLTEIRAPYLRVGLIVAAMLLGSVGSAAGAVLLFAWPVFRRLRDDERRIRAIVETAADGILTIDAQGLVLSANSAAERLFGYSAAELLGRNVSRLMPAPDREQHDDYLRRYLTTGQKKIIGSGREVTGLRKDGSEFPLLLSVSEMQIGRERHFTGIVHDLTDWQRIKSETDARIGAIVETAVDGILTIDTEGFVRSANTAAERLFGYSRTEMIGTKVNRLMPSPYRDQHDDYLRNYLTTGQKKIIGIGREVKGLRKDGTAFPLLLGVSEVRVGEERYFAGIVHDLTEREQFEAQVRASHSLATLGMIARGVAHHFNNGFQVIRSYLEIIERNQTPDDKTRRAFDQIQKTLDRSHTLTQHLLTFSGTAARHPVRQDVAAAMQDVAALLLPALPGGVQVRVDAARATCWALADPRALRNALLQLCLYLADAAASGELRLSVAAVDPAATAGPRPAGAGPTAAAPLAQQAEGDRVTLCLHHSEAVLSAEDQAHLFDGSADSAAGMEQEKLGLVIAARMVAGMQGVLTVESAAGAGATFFLTLPAASATAQTAAPQAT